MIFHCEYKLNLTMLSFANREYLVSTKRPPHSFLSLTFSPLSSMRALQPVTLYLFYLFSLWEYFKKFFSQVCATVSHYSVNFFCNVSFSLVTASTFSQPFVCIAIFTMDKNIEQRVFVCSNEISCAKTLKMLKKTFGDLTMSKTQVYDWYKSIKEGREESNYLPRSGRPSSSSTEEYVDKIKEMEFENRHYSLREIAQEINMSHETARLILIAVLGMRKVGGRLVPKGLNFLQKVNRKK